MGELSSVGKTLLEKLRALDNPAERDFRKTRSKLEIDGGVIVPDIMFSKVCNTFTGTDLIPKAVAVIPSDKNVSAEEILEAAGLSADYHARISRYLGVHKEELGIHITPKKYRRCRKYRRIR